jgi:hypothetical protein
MKHKKEGRRLEEVIAKFKGQWGFFFGFLSLQVVIPSLVLHNAAFASSITGIATNPVTRTAPNTMKSANINSWFMLNYL